VSTTRKTRLWCGGCLRDVGTVENEPFPFRCRHALPGDGIDHVLRRTLHVATWRSVTPPDDEETFVQSWLGANGGWRSAMEGQSPFLKYRQRFYSYHLARANGLPEAEFAAIVAELDDAIQAQEGLGLRATPFARSEALARGLGGAPGAIWVKDETGTVSGSHKARHLFGIMVYLRVVESLLQRGLFPEDAPGAAHVVAAVAEPLAIASCGNAALAAAVVARAVDRALDVYVPPWADASVVSRLAQYRANVHVCERREGEQGDPCYLRFREAVALGAIPFCCQGPANGLTIEGGQTLAYEMLDALEGETLDRVFVQVGGGALASACVRAFEEALAAGAIDRLPRLHAVQTEGAWPLARAWDRLACLVLQRLGDPMGADVRDLSPHERAEAARTIGARADRALLFAALREAATHRGRFMWPWEHEPHSIAHGILDDETYDWLAVVEGMLLSGGWPIVAGEADLERAHDLARHTTGIPVCHSGSAGLAGVLALQRQLGADTPGQLAPSEQVAVLFTGVDRG
jgi:threonine synthase